MKQQPLSQETIKLIEDKAKQLCIENGVKYPNNTLPLVRTTIFHLIKFILTDPAILKSMNLYTLPEMQKQMQDVLEKEEDKWVSVKDKWPIKEDEDEEGRFDIVCVTKDKEYFRSDSNHEAIRTIKNVVFWKKRIPLPSPPSLTK